MVIHYLLCHIHNRLNRLKYVQVMVPNTCLRLMYSKITPLCICDMCKNFMNVYTYCYLPVVKYSFDKTTHVRFLLFSV